MIILIIHISVSYDQNILLIFYEKMDPMSGFDIRLVFTLPPRGSTLEYKRCVLLWNNFPCIITLPNCILIHSYTIEIYSRSHWPIWHLLPWCWTSWPRNETSRSLNSSLFPAISRADTLMVNLIPVFSFTSFTHLNIIIIFIIVFVIIIKRDNKERVSRELEMKK